MSALAFAGSPQFAAISVYGQGGTVAAAAIAAALVASRFMVMGAAAGGSLRGSLARRLLLSQLVVDETWAISYSADKGFDGRRLIGAGVVLYAIHVTATAFGASIGGLIQDPKALGLDVMSPALFVVLLRPLLTPRRSLQSSAQ
jgi:predicted branched-subunit amino acid permease